MSDFNRRDVLGAAAATAVGLLAATGGAEAAGDESQQELPPFPPLACQRRRVGVYDQGPGPHHGHRP